MEIDVSLSYPEQPATGLCPEPAESVDTNDISWCCS
jgi:hypothetical protein